MGPLTCFSSVLLLPYTGGGAVQIGCVLRLDLLESSGVWNYLSSIQKVDSQNGRPSYDPYALFAVILLGFSIGQASLREIETSCKMTFVSFMWPVVYTPVMLLFRASSKKLSHHRKRKFLLACVKKFSINAAFK